MYINDIDMGVEAWIHKDVNVFGHTLRNKDELKESIKECEETMKLCRERLKVLVMMTEPQKMYPNQEDLVWYLGREFEELMDEYDRAQISLTRLWEFEEGWDASHDENGLSILPVDPLTMKNQKVYMGGDYVESVLEDGSEVPDDYWDVYHGFVKPEDCTFRHIYGYEPYVEEPQKTLEELMAEHKADVGCMDGPLGPEIYVTRHNVGQAELDKWREQIQLCEADHKQLDNFINGDVKTISVELDEL